MSDTNENIQPELRLIKILKGVLSKEFGENISNKKLAYSRYIFRKELKKKGN